MFKILLLTAMSPPRLVVSLLESSTACLWYTDRDVLPSDPNPENQKVKHKGSLSIEGSITGETN